MQHSFDKEMNEAISDTEKKVERLKEDTMNKLKGLDQRIADLLEEIDKTLVSQKELQKRVTENAEKAEWVKNFIRQVDDLLTV